MTVSHFTRTRDQLWSDLLVVLGGDEAFLTRSLSERQIILEMLDTYSSSITLRTIDDVDALLAAVVNAAGGSASHLRQNKHEILAALVTALGGTAPSASTSSTGQLLAACVNAAEAGAGSTPEWVPADAKIYIDLIAPGRAWTEDDGEVAIDTLLGADANTVNAWGATSYDAGNLTADGYVRGSGTPPAFIGAARTKIIDQATVVIRAKRTTITDSGLNFVVMSANGNDALEFDATKEPAIGTAYSYGGSLSINTEVATNIGIGAINALACTITNSRFDIALNGVAAVAGSLASNDRPVGNPLVAALFDGNTYNALQSITIYDALPSTAGLSALSVV